MGVLLAQGNGVGHDLLNVGHPQQGRHALAAGAGDRQTNLRLREFAPEQFQRQGHALRLGGLMPPVIRKEGLAPVCGKRHDFCGGGANVNAHRKHLIVQFRLFHLSILAARLCRGRFALALRSGIPRLQAAVRLLSNRTLFRPRTAMGNPALPVQIMSGFIAIFP